MTNAEPNLEMSQPDISYTRLLKDVFFMTELSYETVTQEQIEDVQRVLQLNEFNQDWKRAIMMRFDSKGKKTLKEIAQAGGSNSEETGRRWLAHGINFMRNYLKSELFT